MKVRSPWRGEARTIIAGTISTASRIGWAIETIVATKSF